MPPAQPEPIAALFPEALPPVRGQASDRAYRRGYVPKTYPQSEVDAAKRVIAEWNRQFKDVTGAKRANPGDACNVKTYVKMLRSARRSEGLFDFDEADVIAAIRAYRSDPERLRAGLWAKFSNWLDCENIDFQLNRIGRARHAKEQPRQVARRLAEEHRSAKEIRDHKGLVGLCVKAGGLRQSPRAYSADVLYAARQAGDEDLAAKCLEIIEIFDRFNRLEPAAFGTQRLYARAAEVFRAAYGRAPGQRPHDDARIKGLQLALLDLDAGDMPPAKKEVQGGGD